jgi:hypothetical protein
MFDDVKVKNAQMENCDIQEPGPSLKEQTSNQERYMKTGQLKPGDFVFLDKKEKSFSKSFDYKVLQIRCCKLQ